MKGHPNAYSVEELAWIKDHAAMLRTVAHANFVTTFNRSDVTLGAYASLCKRKGWMTGRDGRFDKGIIPHNTGRPQSEWLSDELIARSRATRFKPGQLPRNTKFEGHERVSKDGYVEISVAQTNPHTGFERRYVLKHRWLWEKQNGPVPQGMCLKSIDGNKTNTDPSNWRLVPRGLLPRLNNRWGRNYDAAPAELKPSIMLLAELQTKVASKTSTKRPS